MGVDDLLDALAARGIKVEVLDHVLRCHPRLPSDLRDAVRAHAKDIALALLPPRTPCACGCHWFWRLPRRRWRCWRCDWQDIPRDAPIESVHLEDGEIRTPRPLAPVAYRCAVCGATYPETVDGASWMQTPDGSYWPRCPECTARGRTLAQPPRQRVRR